MPLAEPKPSASDPHKRTMGASVVDALAPAAGPAQTARAPFTAKPTPPAGVAPTQDEISRRAYEYYQARGGQPGDAVADWLRAERDLRRERGLP